MCPNFPRRLRGVALAAGVCLWLSLAPTPAPAQLGFGGYPLGGYYGAWGGTAPYVRYTLWAQGPVPYRAPYAYGSLSLYGYGLNYGYLPWAYTNPAPARRTSRYTPP